jgi:sugar lactone lactonase YvrE
MATNTASAVAESGDVVVESGWQYRVVAENLPGIDNLCLSPDGSMYATQELRHGAGQVIKLLPGGEINVIVPGLNRPDGLLLRGKYLFITEEIAAGRVIEYDISTNKLRVLATLRFPEGIDMLPDGDLIVSEDAMNGRLLRVRRFGDQAVEVLLDGLNRPEGLVLSQDGAVIFAETGTGRVLAFKNGMLSVMLHELDEPDQIKFAPDGSLWITEDIPNGRLLRFKDGVLETVVSGLHSPQGIAFGADGETWLAEQGRQRILLIRRKALP